MNMRNFWAIELPVGDPHRGTPYGERLDPSTVSPRTAGNIGTGLSSVGTIVRLIGANKSANAAINVGQAQQTEANFEADQLNQNAGQVVAASQRTALDEQRRAELIASRGLALAAAGGGGASDPTVVKLLADITGEGSYRAATAIYQGEDRARQMNMAADAKRYSGAIMAAGGEDKAAAYRTAGISALASGAGSLFSKYGMGGPKQYGLNSTSDTNWTDAGTQGNGNIG
jgi:hypothetical protein